MSIKVKKIKVSPLQDMKAHGGCGYKGSHTYTAIALGRVRVAGPMLGCLYPWYSLQDMKAHGGCGYKGSHTHTQPLH